MVCTECGCIKENYIPHNWGNWSKNATYHSHTCKDCGLVVKSDHDYPDASNPSSYKFDDKNTGYHWLECSSCGYVDTTSKKRHTIDSDTWFHNNTHHRKGCTVCTYATEEERHNLDWVYYYENGVQKHKQVCDVCDVLLNDGEHIWQWTSDTEKHWQRCRVCPETKNESEHTFSEKWSADRTYHWHECTYVTDEQ